MEEINTRMHVGNSIENKNRIKVPVFFVYSHLIVSFDAIVARKYLFLKMTCPENALNSMSSRHNCAFLRSCQKGLAPDRYLAFLRPAVILAVHLIAKLRRQIVDYSVAW